jgi:hypothetical protein
MQTLLTQKYQQLTTLMLASIILLVLLVQSFIVNKPIINPMADLVLVIFASVGFYRILIATLHFLVSNNQWLLKTYWGRYYLHGLWYYTYNVNVNGNDEIRCGIWRFEQDLFGTKIVGYGLTDGFEIRTRLASVTQLIDNNGFYEVSNLKSDAKNPEKDFYSRTSLSFDLCPNGSVFPYPRKIRGLTTIYGGISTGELHHDTFIKVENASTEDDVIDALKENLIATEQKAQ